MRGPVQGGVARVVDGVDLAAQLEGELDGGERADLGDAAFSEVAAEAGRDHQRRRPVVRGEPRIGAVLREHSHDLDVPGHRRQQERRRAGYGFTPTTRCSTGSWV